MGAISNLPAPAGTRWTCGDHPRPQALIFFTHLLLSHGKQANLGSLDSGAAHMIRNHRLVVQQQHDHVENNHLETRQHIMPVSNYIAMGAPATNQASIKDVVLSPDHE